MKTMARIGWVTLLAMSIAAPAQAHHAAQVSGFSHALAHSLLGWDQLLALVALFAFMHGQHGWRLVE
jgi:hydrogenase/urease accessory protein HupE